MGTEVKSVKLSKLKDYRDPKNADPKDYYLEVPSFQRGLVWSQAKKSELIKSIFEEFPVGALLFFIQKSETGGRDTAQIIDGLQRTTAILDYLAEPLKIAPIASEFITAEMYQAAEEFANTLGVDLPTAIIERAVSAWAATNKTIQVATFSGKSLRKAIETERESLFSPEFADKLEDYLANEILAKLQKIFSKLSDYEIPVIEYSGSEENLPEIFQRLNSGTPLTKYDKFGAAWSSKTTFTKNASVRSAVRDRLKEYVENDWEVNNFDPNTDLGETDLNIFEYLVGLGQFLSDRHPRLFGAHTSSGEVPTLAFAIFTLCHGLRLSDMSSLPSLMSKNSRGEIDPSKLEKIVDDACFKLNHLLEPYLAFKLNQKNDERFIPHSEMLVISWIARLVVEGHNPTDWSARPGVTQEQLLLANFLPHYVVDIVDERWKGSGDSKAYARVWENSNKEKVATHLSSVYLQKITKDDLAKTLSSFQDQELRKNQRDRPNISAKAKLLLRLIYSDIVTVKAHKSIQFEIEHLHPVAKLNEFIETKNLDGLPISAMGNLAIIPKDDNVIKGKNYLGDYMARNPEKLTDLEKLQDYVLAPDMAEIREANLTDPGIYLDFCARRFETQTALVQKSLSL